MRQPRPFCDVLPKAAIAAGLAGVMVPMSAQAQDLPPDSATPIIRDLDPSMSDPLEGGPRAEPDAPIERSRDRDTATEYALNVLVLLAHPDDELPFAPVLARIARGGGSVTVVFATSGDAGPGVSGMGPGAELAALREQEGRCAAFALGVSEPIYWRLGDGQLATMARAPDSAARDMTQRTKDLIQIVQPSAVMTWGPDGGYGHADHRMISAVATQVIQTMGTNRPDLLYLAFPSDAGDAPPGFEGWARLNPELISDQIRYEIPDLDATRVAIDCYQSQFSERARAFLPQMLHSEIWQGRVQFRSAFPERMLAQ